MQGKTLLQMSAVLFVVFILSCGKQPATQLEPKATAQDQTSSGGSAPPGIKVGAIVWFEADYHPFRDERARTGVGSSTWPAKVEELKGNWIRVSPAQEKGPVANAVSAGSAKKEAWVNFNMVNFYVIER
jgi:hypothetical protein